MYSTADINQMSYKEYGEIVDSLVDKIQEYCQQREIEIDMVAPILRSGGIPGNIIAIKLGINRILPLQFKYSYNPTRIVQVLTLPDVGQLLPEIPRILICENSTVTGNTAAAAIELLKERFPKAELYYATVAKVYGGPNAIAGIADYFCGIETDEKLRLSEIELQEKHVRPKITIFPWENSEKELQAINSIEE